MYAKVIYPAIYQKEYEEPVQTSLFDEEPLDSDKDILSKAGAEARKKGQFQSGNKYRFTKTPSKDQLTMDDIEEVSEE